MNVDSQGSFPAEASASRTMSAEEREHAARRVIRDTMWWSMGAGLVPPPFADVVAISSVHLGMLKALAAIYDVKYSDDRGKAVIAALTGSLIAHVVARDVTADTIAVTAGSEPFLGSMSLWQYAGASGYAVGRILAHHFATVGTLTDFSPARYGQYFREQFEEGARLAESMRQKASYIAAPDADATLA